MRKMPLAHHRRSRMCWNVLFVTGYPIGPMTPKMVHVKSNGLECLVRHRILKSPFSEMVNVKATGRCCSRLYGAICM